MNRLEYFSQLLAEDLLLFLICEAEWRDQLLLCSLLLEVAQKLVPDCGECVARLDLGQEVLDTVARHSLTYRV